MVAETPMPRREAGKLFTREVLSIFLERLIEKEIITTGNNPIFEFTPQDVTMVMKSFFIFEGEEKTWGITQVVLNKETMKEIGLNDIAFTKLFNGDSYLTYRYYRALYFYLLKENTGLAEAFKESLLNVYSKRYERVFKKKSEA